MKNLIYLAVFAMIGLASCSTVSSILQNNFPFTSNFVVTKDSPAQTNLSAIGSGTSINQILGSSQNVKDIRVQSANVTVTDGTQGMGVFRNIKIYITSGSNEILVAERSNISDNIGNQLVLDINNRVLDNIMKSGNSVQQKIVYELKSSPTSDLTIKSSLNFTSVPVTNESK
ncbi:MAG: hypothetical protein Q4G27_08220 [Flavobacteriaceae bacterium]|nr:hypothetical protein [Flavobacteriaceae bacterium]